jgi:hypothetical protein
MEGERSASRPARFALKKKELPSFRDSLPVPYQAMLRNNSEERRPHLHRRERLSGLRARLDVLEKRTISCAYQYGRGNVLNEQSNCLSRTLYSP